MIIRAPRERAPPNARVAAYRSTRPRGPRRTGSRTAFAVSFTPPRIGLLVGSVGTRWLIRRACDVEGAPATGGGLALRFQLARCISGVVRRSSRHRHPVVVGRRENSMRVQAAMRKPKIRLCDRLRRRRRGRMPGSRADRRACYLSRTRHQRSSDVAPIGDRWRHRHDWWR